MIWICRFNLSIIIYSKGVIKLMDDSIFVLKVCKKCIISPFSLSHSKASSGIYNTQIGPRLAISARTSFPVRRAISNRSRDRVNPFLESNGYNPKGAHPQHHDPRRNRLLLGSIFFARTCVLQSQTFARLVPDTKRALTNKANHLFPPKINL